MSCILIKNIRIITPYRVIEEGMILVEDGKIKAESPESFPIPGDAVIFDGKGRYAAPGFIDLHTHGAGGSDFMDGTPQAFLNAARTHLEHGTTLMVPTTVTGTTEGIMKTLRYFEEAKKDVAYGRILHGLHLEGPYFAMEQRGAQDPAYIRDPDPVEYRKILDASDSIVRWSAAPERPGAMEFGICLRERGILPSIGHSDAMYEDVIKAFECGFTLATHLYSGMSSLRRVNAYRKLGVIESALEIEEMDVELIADGSHLPAELIRLVYRIKGAGRIALITDSIRAAGTQVKESIIGSRDNGLPVIVEDGVAKLPDRSAFAGSVATMDRLLYFIWKKVGIPLADTIRMMTSTPARILGMDRWKGKLAPGMDADIVLFGEDAKIRAVMLNGTFMVGGEE